MRTMQNNLAPLAFIGCLLLLSACAPTAELMQATQDSYAALTASMAEIKQALSAGDISAKDAFKLVAEAQEAHARSVMDAFRNNPGQTLGGLSGNEWLDMALVALATQIPGLGFLNSLRNKARMKRNEPV